MASSGVAEGVFVTTSRYTDDARRFASSNSITLIDGQDLVDRVNRLSPRQRGSVFAEVSNGDYAKPTCPNCDIKLEL